MSTPSGRIRVLHVDDDPAFLDLATTFLEREDARIEVETATDAPAGLDRLEDGEIDCLVSDYDMPGMNGIEFLENVRETCPELPFILFTGKGSEEVASEAITAGVTDYLQKGSGTERYELLANRIVNVVDRTEALRQIELSHRAMETASEGLSLVAPDGTFSYVNPAFAHLFGYSPEELVGTEWTVLYEDESADRLASDILPAVRENDYWSSETVRAKKDGERIVTDHRLAHTDEGVIVCTARDVTGERTADGAGNAPFELLVDTLQDRIFFALDHEGYVTRWTDGARRLMGYDAESALGEHFSTFVGEDGRRDVDERLLGAATSNDSVSRREALVTANGDRVRTDLTISATRDDHGTLRGFGILATETVEDTIEM